MIVPVKLLPSRTKYGFLFSSSTATTMKRAQNSSPSRTEVPKKKAKVVETVTETVQEIQATGTGVSDGTGAGEWTKVEKRKKKKEKRTEQRMTTQPRFMYSNSDIAQRHHAVGIEEIRDLALHIIADSPPPNWLRVDNAALIPKVLILLIPGLTPDILSLPPLPTSATSNPNLPISIPLPPRNVPGNAQTGLPFIASTFSHACPTKAPGDQTRMHSILSTFFSCPITTAERKRRMEQQQHNGRLRDQDPSQYLLTVEQMIENEYPVPSYMASVFEKTPGWVETPEQPKESSLTPSKGKPKRKVYSIDCEMCLTEAGKELTRVCVIDFYTQKVIYDSLVKPSKPVTDYLTRWSGITAEALATANTTFSEAQAHILKLLSPPPPNPFSTSKQSTPTPPTPILIGHSLESDLKALKICHPLCIDTALLYHHPRGRPLKPGLAWLTKKWCNREIQTRGEGGHDPEEDARACLELLQKKIAEGPGFGEFKTDYESIFERMNRAHKRSGGGPGSIRTAVVDRGNPGMMHGNKSTKSVGCEDDDEVVKAILDLTPSHDFVFGRLMALANLKGWTTPKQAPDAPPPPPSPPPTQEELDANLTQLNTQLKTIYAALPSSTALIIFTGHSDPRNMVALNARKNAFETAIRSGKPTDTLEKDEQWKAGDVRALEEAVELTKRGLLFLGIKTKPMLATLDKLISALREFTLAHSFKFPVSMAFETPDWCYPFNAFHLSALWSPSGLLVTFFSGHTIFSVWPRNDFVTAQSLNVILDTGSSDLWVVSDSCQTCTKGTPMFNTKSSSSLKTSSEGTTIRYGSGEVSGSLAADTVQMAGFTVPSQGFLTVDTTSAQLLQGSVSGIMGLGFSPLSSTGATPFWETLANKGQLTNQEMAFWLTRFRGQDNVASEEPGGVFTLGGVNNTLFTGDIEFLKTTGDPSFWLLNLMSVTVNGKSVSVTTGDSALSAIDTGTTLIGGPTNDVEAIWNAVPNSGPVRGMDGFFAFPCDTNVAVSMSFGGKSWGISTADMNLGPVNSGSSFCLGGIFDLSLGSNIESGQGNPNWVVGATFLKNVYSVFQNGNPPQIGFAQLSGAAGGSGTVPSSSSSDGSTLTGTDSGFSIIGISSTGVSPTVTSTGPGLVTPSIGPSSTSGSGNGSNSVTSSINGPLMLLSGLTLLTSWLLA
ncbi:hypothetical protein D9758_011478 [Tetrapyrgos nigripes]|uniref:Peptidase A1 domain-containing protein n=1 Tax=Tetrapyrgos nigripes TaxID=182062 RepID=A0A8H5FRD7_9AGAR|nr:hypothetical protein D9758_011478 [Tetrapyrgos nigripes]